jgi:hypothetical protein
MRGFMTTDGRYYETENGQIDPSDREVPVRSPEHQFLDENDVARGTRVSDSYRADKVVFGLRDVISILAVATMVVGLYYALKGNVSELSTEIKVQSVQIQDIKEAQIANTQTIHGELEDLKKRLDEQGNRFQAHIDRSRS